MPLDGMTEEWGRSSLVSIPNLLTLQATPRSQTPLTLTPIGSVDRRCRQLKPVTQRSNTVHRYIGDQSSFACLPACLPCYTAWVEYVIMVASDGHIGRSLLSFDLSFRRMLPG